VKSQRITYFFFVRMITTGSLLLFYSYLHTTSTTSYYYYLLLLVLLLVLVGVVGLIVVLLGYTTNITISVIRITDHDHIESNKFFPLVARSYYNPFMLQSKVDMIKSITQCHQKNIQR
jgi:hypothetical protein